MLTRQSVNSQEDKRTDIWAVDQGNISITPLHLFLENRIPARLFENLTLGLLDELKSRHFQ